MKIHSQPLNVVIVGYLYKFPNGQGASARIAQYAQGFSAKGVNTTILCLKPTESPDGPIINKDVSGKYHRAEFLYTSGTSIYSKNKLIKYLQNIQGILGAIRAIHEVSKKSRIDAVILYGTDSFIYTLIFWTLTKIYRTCFIGENTEAPFVYSRPSIINKFKKIVVCNISHKMFDGFIVISTYLENTFKKTLRDNSQIIKIPVLVNVDDFCSYKILSEVKTKSIIYCGNLGNKGEVSSLLKSWEMINKDFPDWKVQIIGDNSSSKIYEPIVAEVENLGLTKSIEFTGFVTRDKLMELLLNGQVMVLPRASGVFSDAGLPNKLGEYLATGKPVVITRTGDIDVYLKNRHSAYIVDSDNISLFSEALRFVLNNPEEASKVGQHGLEVAKNQFDTEANCVRLIQFIYDVRRRKFSI